MYKFTHLTSLSSLHNLLNRPEGRGIKPQEIKELDFEKIPDIVSTPNYVIIGAKSKGRDILAFAKTLDIPTRRNICQKLSRFPD